MQNKSFLFIFVLLLLAGSMHAQSKQLERANKLYKAKLYSEAAKLYEQVPSEKMKLSTKSKLAFCYRINNKTEVAEKLYAEIVQAKKAKADTYFYYGEMLMSNGKYQEAKQWFLDYEKLKPEDDRARIMAEACDKVAFIKPYFSELKIDEYAHNSPEDDSAPIFWEEGLIFSSDRSPGAAFLKQKSGFTGRDYINLFYSKKDKDGQWAAPEKMTGKLTELNKNTSNASFTPNGTSLYFSRNNNQTSRKQAYNMALFSVQFAGGNKWKNLELLEFCSPEYNFMHPAVSPDGQFLVYVSDKPKGNGGTDLWMVERTKKGWSRSKNLGPRVNTLANEGYPYIDHDGRLYFCSKGHLGFGGFDIFVSERDSLGEWQDPVNLGRPINSPMDDISIYIAKNRTSGCFTSNRSGGDDDIFLFSILDENEHSSPAVWQPEEGEEEEEVVEISANTPTVLEETQQEDSLVIVQKEVLEISEKETLVFVEKTEVIASTISAEIVENIETNDKDTSNIIVPISEKITLQVLKKTPVDTIETIILASIDTLENMSLDTINETKIDSLSRTSLPDFFYLDELINQLTTSELDTSYTFRVDSVLFDYEAYQITPMIAVQLDEIVDLLTVYPDLMIEIGAHTESQGDDYNNLILSRYRAEAAASYITKNGVESYRIKPHGYGESRILNQCKNGLTCAKEDHLFNQRLEVRVLSY